MKISLLFSLMVFVAGIFYWFELRPALAKKECDHIAFTQGQERQADTAWYTWKYNQCLHSKGL